MKATGIVRRIDDLGRVVIPKEIRRTLRLHEGTPLEIFTDREGEIILKKYSPMMELTAFSSQYAEAMAQSTGLMVCITDRDQVIAVSGGPRKDYLQKSISRQLEVLIGEPDCDSREGRQRLYPHHPRRAGGSYRSGRCPDYLRGRCYRLCHPVKQRTKGKIL